MIELSILTPWKGVLREWVDVKCWVFIRIDLCKESLRMKSLVYVAFFMFLVGGNEYASADTFYLTFHNTGSEDVYYSTAIRGAKLFGWGDWRASGWYALPAGSSRQVYAGADEQVVFAFKKRGGYIKFKNRNSRSGKSWIKGWHVAKSDVFDYRFENQSRPGGKLDGFVEMSFGYHYESRSWGTSHIVRQSVNINTSKDHRPIPWPGDPGRKAKKRTISPDDFLKGLDAAIEKKRKGESKNNKRLKGRADERGLERLDGLVEDGRGSEVSINPDKRDGESRSPSGVSGKPDGDAFGLERIENLLGEGGASNSD